MTPRVPALAERLLGWILPTDDRATMLGDLSEEFVRRHDTDGPRLAREWYWRQVRHSLRTDLVARVWFRSASSERPVSSHGAFAIESIVRDVRDAIRGFRRDAAFTTITLVLLTLGIGASTAVFSVVDGVALRSLPFPDSDRLVTLSEPRLDRIASRESAPVTPQDFRDWVANAGAFESLAAYTGGPAFDLQASEPEPLPVIRTTASLFSVLRVAPALGRAFTSANEVAGNNRVVVISDALWRRRFGAASDAIGKVMRSSDGDWEVVGVMPPGFMFPIDSHRDLWMPYVVPPGQTIRGPNRDYNLQVVGRLRPGATVAGAQSAMLDLNRALAIASPGWFNDRTVIVHPLRDTVIGEEVRSWMLMLLGAVGLVLLIACANVAGLMLARASARGREMSVRGALGASRAQLVRTLIVESLVLSLAGCGLGVGLAYWGVTGLRAILPPGVPRATAIAVNWRVLAAAIATSLVTGLAFGLAPALQLSRNHLTLALRDGGRGGTATLRRLRARGVLVTAEIALAMVLLVAAGLFLSSFVRMTSVDLGLDYRNILTVRVAPRLESSSPDSRAKTSARVAAVVEDVLPRLRSIAGVSAVAAFSGGLPLEGSTYRTNVEIAGRESEFRSSDDQIDVYRVSSDYSKVLGVPLLRGRLLTAADDASASASAPVVLLNQTAADRYFAGQDALGQSLRLLGGPRTVVGILRSVRAGGPEASFRPEVYLPLARDAAPFAYLIVKTTGDPMAVAPTVKSVVWSVAPNLPLSEVEPLEGYLDDLLAPRRFNVSIVGLFGVLAVVIASVGIYGLVGFVVEERTREIGIRMALGARPNGVVALMLRRALILITVGLACGLATAWEIASLLRVFLFQIEPHDVVVYLLAACVLAACGLLAAFSPASRAARIDPLIVLKAD